MDWGWSRAVFCHRHFISLLSLLLISSASSLFFYFILLTFSNSFCRLPFAHHHYPAILLTVIFLSPLNLHPSSLSLAPLAPTLSTLELSACTPFQLSLCLSSLQNSHRVHHTTTIQSIKVNDYDHSASHTFL